MNFYGRKHPLFSTFVEKKIDKATYTPTRHCPTHISYHELDNNSKYFIHPGLPILDPRLNVEYIFNFEDQCTLYHAAENGHTANFDFLNSEETITIKNALEDPRCKKIICHIEKMANALPKLTNSSIIAEKTVYKKIGVRSKNYSIDMNKEDFTILFTNSYHDDPRNFFYRGGHFLLAVFEVLSKKYKNINLIIRSSIPENIKINNPKIKLYNNYLNYSEINNLYMQSDVVVLPSMRVHSHSLCEAISYGIPVITTNGWGIDEFIKHNKNGYIIEGFENLSWNNENIGCIENYGFMFNNMKLVNDTCIQLHMFLEKLIASKEELYTMRLNTIEESKKYPLENWNEWTI